MKRILSLIFTLLILSGCQSFDVHQALKSTNRNFNDRLPKLEAVFENEKSVKHWSPGEKLVKENSHWATIFYREVEDNLIEPHGDMKGYIVLRPIFHEAKVQGYWYLTPLFTLWTANILGCPMNKYEAVAELEIDILDKKGNLLKRYSEELTDSEYVAFYWGYPDPIAIQAALYNSYKKSLGSLLNKIYEDRNYLSRKLN